MGEPHNFCVWNHRAADPLSMHPFRVPKRLKGDTRATEIALPSTPAAATRPAKFRRKALIRIKLEVDSENEPCEEVAPPILTSGATNAARLAQSTSVKQEMANVDHLPFVKLKCEPLIEDTSGCGAQTAIKSEE